MDSDLPPDFISVFEVNSRLIELKRRQCDDRGYHVVDRIPGEEDLCAICSDCESRFDPNNPSRTYRVLSHELSQ